MPPWPCTATVAFVAGHISRRTGFTLDPDNALAGCDRSTGYAIAAGGYVQVFSPGQFSITCVSSALRELGFWRTAMSIDSPPLFVGGWFDADASEYLLALTAVIQCPREARRLAAEHKQRFVYSFALGRDVAVADLSLSCPVCNAS